MFTNSNPTHQRVWRTLSITLGLFSAGIRVFGSRERSPSRGLRAVRLPWGPRAASFLETRWRIQGSSASGLRAVHGRSIATWRAACERRLGCHDDERRSDRIRREACSVFAYRSIMWPYPIPLSPHDTNTLTSSATARPPEPRKAHAGRPPLSSRPWAEPGAGARAALRAPPLARSKQDCPAPRHRARACRAHRARGGGGPPAQERRFGFRGLLRRDQGALSDEHAGFPAEMDYESPEGEARS